MLRKDIEYKEKILKKNDLVAYFKTCFEFFMTNWLYLFIFFT